MKNKLNLSVIFSEEHLQKIHFKINFPLCVTTLAVLAISLISGFVGSFDPHKGPLGVIAHYGLVVFFCLYPLTFLLAQMGIRKKWIYIPDWFKNNFRI